MHKMKNKILTIGILTLILINANIGWARNRSKPLKTIRIYINPSNIQNKINNYSSNTQINNNFQAEVVRLVNAERRKRGINAVSISNKLSSAASLRASEITQKFSHRRPDGRNFISAAESLGYTFSYIGENIAAGQKSPEDVMNIWMNSPGHRANILNPEYTEIGVGLDYANNIYGLHWVQLFGRPK